MLKQEPSWEMVQQYQASRKFGWGGWFKVYRLFVNGYGWIENCYATKGGPPDMQGDNWKHCQMKMPDGRLVNYYWYDI